MANVTYVSVYLSPNLTVRDFDTRLAELEDTLRDIAGGLVIEGDINGRPPEWSIPSTNKRGRAVLDMAANLELQVECLLTSSVWWRTIFHKECYCMTR